MRISITLIDKARSLCSPATDYQLAKRLGISHATVSRCRHRGGTLDNEASTRLAELLGQDPMDVIAVMEAERAKTPAKKAFWENRLPRVMPLVAYLGIISGMNHVSHERLTIAADRLTSDEVVRQSIHYAQWLYMRTGRARARLRNLSRDFATWLEAQIHHMPARSPACRGFAPHFSPS